MILSGSKDAPLGLCALILLGWLLSISSPVVHARTEPFVIEDIRLEGLQRVSPSAIFSVLPLGVGDTLTSADVALVIRDLFGTANFDDVRISRSANVMVISLVERPFINEITITGNKAIRTSDLLEGLNEQELSSGQVLKRVALEGIRQELRRQYSSRGRYDSDVSAEIELLPRNRVRIALVIDEGTPAHVYRINIVGNKLFPTALLIKNFESRNAGGFLGFFGKKGQYARETLSSDLDRLGGFYKNRGYLDFSIDSVQVSVTPDQKAVFIGVSVDEGELFTVRDINFFGDLVLDEKQLRRFVFSKKDTLYSEIQVTNTETLLTRLLNNEGYLEAKIRGVPHIEQGSHDVELRFIVTPGQRTYVRRITFSGNTNTNDEVLRREMRQLEGAPASRAAIDNSRVRLERLRFIRGVQIDTVPVVDSNQEVDVEVSIEQQSSGNIVFSLGYNETYGALYQLSLQRDNFFGTGRNINVKVRKDRASESFSLSYVEPYFTPDGISRSFNLYSRDIDLEQINITRYATRSIGGGVNFGYPLNETANINFGFSYDKTDISVGSAPVQEISATPLPFSGVTHVLMPVTPGTTTPVQFVRDLDLINDLLPTSPGFVNREGDEFDGFKFSLSWNVFRLNRGQLATRGYAQSFSVETTLPGSDLDYYKLRYRVEHFLPLGNSFTLRTLVRLGYGDGHSSDDVLPFFEHFFTGGLNSVRGYETNTLGPRSTPARFYQRARGAPDPSNPDDTVVAYVLGPDNCPQGVSQCLQTSQVFTSDRPNPYGGNLQAILNFELLFPLPFAIDQRSVRAGLFLDIGNVFDTNCAPTRTSCEDFSVDELRATIGIGLVWITPFGPLNFSFSEPLNDKRGDDTDTFEFSIGTGFGF